MSDRPSRVIQIPYLNSVSYYVRWDELAFASEGRWVSAALPPRQLGMAMASGEADAGLLPVADLIRLQDSVTPLELEIGRVDGVKRLGIACRSRVDSVLLFVRDREGGRPFSGRRPSLTLDTDALDGLRGARIAITDESSTSVRLLRLLLEVRHGVVPGGYERASFAGPGGHERASFAGPGGYERAPLAGPGGYERAPFAGPGGYERAPFAGPGVTSERALPLDKLDRNQVAERFDAALVIGDQALRWRVRPPDGFIQAMDLASEWCDWTGLPFVFACWAVRKDLDPARARWLGQFLVASLDEADMDLSRLTQHSPADLGSSALLTDYLRNFIYRLGSAEIDSMARFSGLLQEHGIACTAE